MFGIYPKRRFDIVSGQTGIPYDKIKIVEAK